MALSTGEKWVLGLLGVAAVLGLAGAGLSASTFGRDEDFDDDDEDELPPGRSLELAVLDELYERYGSRRVLDNPTLPASDGGLMRPDGVAIDKRGNVLEVREAKDVAELRREHVYQAAFYDQQLEPKHGTTLDVHERAFIDDDVSDLADGLGIGIETWTDEASG
jgi:hypothetical protein